MQLYSIFYIFANIFSCYTIYKFMGLFFDRKDINKKIELLSYIGYYVAISVLYLVNSLPLLLLISNIISFILISFNYNSTIQKKIMASICIYITLMLVEIFVGITIGHVKLSAFIKSEFSSIYGLLAIRIISFAIVLVLLNFKNIKYNMDVSITNWGCLLFVPIGSLYIILLIFQSSDISNFNLFFSSSIVFIVNFAIFYLYDSISKNIIQKMEKVVLIEQNNSYEKQLQIMDDYQRSLKMLKHDMKNHMHTIYDLIKNNECEECLEHISGMLDIIKKTGDYVNSDNIVINSILNFKLEQAKNKGIDFHISVKVSNNLSISSFDMAALIGNLMDNSIEAITKLDNKGKIDISIREDKGRLLITIKNPYKGEICFNDNNIITTKADKVNHGLGIKNVDNILKKYDGEKK